MRKAEVYRNTKLAGVLIEHGANKYEFRYTNDWIENDRFPSISLTLPKNQQSHFSNHLFPFFFNMLSEGANKKLQCRQLKIDENDHFGLLLATLGADSIGAITIKPL